MTALDPKADIKLVLVVMAANDPKRPLEYWISEGLQMTLIPRGTHSISPPHFVANEVMKIGGIYVS